MKLKTTLTTLSFGLLFFSSAHACMGPMFEVFTFLSRLPQDISAPTFVAKVEIIDLDDRSYSGLARVKALEVTKGEEPKEPFQVMFATHSCARNYGIKVGQSAYIAGAFDEAGTFKGEWKGMHPGEAQFTDEEYLGNPK